MPDKDLEFSLTDSFERNPDGALLLDRDWVIRHANRAAAALFRRELAELVDQPLQRVLPEWTAGGLGEALRTVAATHDAVMLPTHELESGAWVAPRVVASRSGFTIVLRDTSDQKRVELALGERERQYRFLSEALPQQLWTAMPDGHLDFVNRHVLDYFGRTAEEMLADGWQAVVHPADLGDCLQRWLHSLATGEPYEIEFRLRDAHGAYRWHLARAQAMRDGHGAIVRWFGANTDIDDHKRVEQAHRFLLEASAVLSSSLDFEVTLASIARLSVPHIADWCSVHLVDGDELRQVAVAHVDPSRVEYARELARRYPVDPSDRTGVAQVIRSGAAELVPELDDAMLVASARDPEHLRIARGLGLRSYMCVPMRSRERGPIGAITLVASDSGRRYGPADLAVAEELANRCALAIDGAVLLRHAQAAEQQSRQLSEELERRVDERTAELVRARDRLSEANARLRDVDSTKEEMIGALSFQLVGPLDAVLGGADNLLDGSDGPLREEQRAIVRRIAASSRLMLSLVHDLLDRSRMSSGHFVLSRDPVDVCAQVREALAMLGPILAMQGLRVVTRFPNAPAMALADAPRLEQVLIAVLHNALQISSPGALLRVAVDTDASNVRVEVQHTGERLAEAAVAGVFQKFTRHEGAWLGLPTAHRIIQAHDGRIGIEPGATGGNVFWFTLPRLADEPR